MFDQPEWAYHLARCEQCRRMGLLAPNDGIRKIHEALAAEHAKLARRAFFATPDVGNGGPDSLLGTEAMKPAMDPEAT